MTPLDHILSASGPIAAALGPGFEPRPEQAEMARAVAAAMERRSHLLVEAGTGVGKSFAYLVPAILRACLHRETVVVATNTIALQEQLVQKDIPVLQKALEDAGIIPKADDVVTPLRFRTTADDDYDDDLDTTPTPHAPAVSPPRPLKAVLVKGRGNYVSVRRLKLASARQDRLFPDAASRRTLHIIEDWAMETLDGTLSTLPTAALERPAVWDRVQSDSGNCMGRRCPEYERCFYQAARREMEGANLLICNHALFFSDLALRAQEVGFLPTYHQVVLDEAHGVEDAASDHFGLSLSEGRCIHLLNTLYSPRHGKGYLPGLGVVVGDQGEIDRAVRLVLAAEQATRAFFDALLSLHRRGGNGRIREPGAVENLLTPAFRDLSLRLSALRDHARNEQDKFELAGYAQRAQEIAVAAAALIDQTLEGCVYWVEARGEEDDGPTRAPRITLACSPVEVGPILKARLFAGECGVVLTSATLAEGGATPREPATALAGGDDGFAHIAARLGCENAATLRLGSPFDYATQVEFIVETGIDRPDSTPGRSARAGPRRAPRRVVDELDQRPPNDDAIEPSITSAPDSVFSTPDARSVSASLRLSNAPDYPTQLARRILAHVQETEGGAFVLFTSFATLFAVADRIRPALFELGLPLLVQGRDGPRTALLERFRADERSVLFGAASFWQGVDVRGRGLRNVIITKLPFDPPDRPLTEARAELILARGGNPFMDDALPRAVIRFKQGFGRLIRGHADRGRVVVLDPRILTARYGRRFLEALPAGVSVVER